VIISMDTAKAANKTPIVDIISLPVDDFLGGVGLKSGSFMF
jgi:hypothetical protein